MNSPRSWNRREFNVTANGYFTVLRPAGWFSTVPLPKGFRYLVGQSRRNPSRQLLEGSPENPTRALPYGSTSESDLDAQGHASGQETAVLSQSMIPGTLDHGFMRILMRASFIVLAAIAITFALLWFSGDCDDIRGFLSIPRG